MSSNQITHKQDAKVSDVGLGLAFKLVIAFAVVLVLALLATLVYLIAPGPVPKTQTTAFNVKEYYTNTEPPSIPKWAYGHAAPGR